jgi:tetratricopeptide (TPR) repeat protein
LIALAMRCLAADPAARPPNAGETAAAVTHYQESVAERLRRAELEQAAEAARTEEAKATAVAERRARRLTLGLAVAVLLLVAAGAAGGLWAQRQYAEREAESARQRQAVEAALDKAQELRQQTRWAEARAVLEQTRDRLGETGPADLTQRLERAVADLALVDRLEGIRLQRATLVEGRFDLQTAERDYAAAFRDAGLGEEGQPVEAVAARVRAAAVGAQLVAALDDWATLTRDRPRRAWLLAVARRADPDPWSDRLRAPLVWGDRAALQKLAGALLRDEARLKELKPSLLAALGHALFWTKADAVPLLAAAQARHPDDFWLNSLLGDALRQEMRWDEAVGYYRGALAVRPKTVAVRVSLGNALVIKGQPDAAIAEYRAAIAQDPKLAGAHNGLGNALRDQGQLDAAVGAFRTAIALDPKNAGAHSNLGIALYVKKQLGAAIKAYRAAIALDATLAPPHYGLGLALRDQGQLGAAIKAYRAAIALDPKDAKPHHELGNALRDQGHLDDAIAEYRAAIALDPKDAKPLHHLGLALQRRGRVDEAIKAFRAAIALDPKDARAHSNLGALLCDGKHDYDGAIASFRAALALDPNYAKARHNLGTALQNKGQLDEAIPEFRAAIALDPQYAQAYGALGLALLRLGRFAEAREAAGRCLELLPPGHPQHQLTTRLLRQCEQSLALDQKLPAILGGKERPADDAERLKLARLCQEPFKKLYVVSARFYAEAFANAPELADGLKVPHRYNAACAAALAGRGLGKDDPAPDAGTKAKLRRQALDWLRADLTAYAKLLAGKDPKSPSLVRQRMRHWQQDADFRGVRGEDALAKLPETERPDWRALWADVAALLKKAGAGQ